MTTQLQIQINNVEADKIRSLRHSELRKGYNFSTTSYLKDYEEETFHLACVIDDMIITCATFYPQSSIKVKAKKAYRLRGMATDFNFKRQGYGTQLIQEAFVLLKEKGSDLLWCNARLVAVSFYEALGFKITGKIFDIKGIGPHYYMYKEI